jgi:hypothetical protein
MDLNGTRFVLLRLLRHRGGFQLLGYACCLNSRPEAHWSWTIGKNCFFQTNETVLSTVSTSVSGGRHLLAAAFNTLNQLHIQAERLQFTNQHVEGLGHAGFNGGLAFHNGLVNLGAAKNVV